MRNWPALTGLRGAAVLAVMWGHGTFPNQTIGLPGGFFAVDAFFVLSAMLITALMVVELDKHGDISLKLFYVRRALRLLPALFACVALVVLLQLTVGSVGSGLGHEIVGALLYVENWVAIATPGESSYLDHLWSLSVEEQFYFVWPVILTGLLRKGIRPAVIARGTAVVALVAWLLRWYLYDRHHGTAPTDFRVFYLNTGARIDELMVGCTLGLLSPAVWKRVAWLSLPGLLALLVLIHVARIRADMVYEWGQTAAAVCAVLIVAAGATGHGVVTRVFSWKPIVGAGTIAYGLYLYHLPIVLAVDQQGYGETTRIVLNLLLPFPVSIASWYLLEKPALRLKSRFQRASV